MKRPLILIGFFVAVALGAGLAYASPYITISRVRAAAAKGDAETVNTHIDYPALRESLKGWIGASMAKEMAKSNLKDNPIAALGAALALVMVDKMVDAMVTPEGVRMMLEGQRPRPQPQGQGKREEKSGQPSNTQTQMSYEAYDSFIVKVRKKDRPADEFTMVWRRSGFTWKLSALRMPAPE